MAAPSHITAVELAEIMKDVFDELWEQFERVNGELAELRRNQAEDSMRLEAVASRFEVQWLEERLQRLESHPR